MVNVQKWLPPICAWAALVALTSTALGQGNGRRSPGGRQGRGAPPSMGQPPHGQGNGYSNGYGNGYGNGPGNGHGKGYGNGYGYGYGRNPGLGNGWDGNRFGGVVVSLGNWGGDPWGGGGPGGWGWSPVPYAYPYHSGVVVRGPHGTVYSSSPVFPRSVRRPRIEQPRRILAGWSNDHRAQRTLDGPTALLRNLAGNGPRGRARHSRLPAKAWPVPRGGSLDKRRFGAMM